MSIVKVEGENKDHDIFLYTLSTCGWCKKTKRYLKEEGFEYEYLDVDTCSAEERKEATEDIKNRELPLGFPVIIIDGDEVISGFNKRAIREALNID